MTIMFECAVLPLLASRAILAATWYVDPVHGGTRYSPTNTFGQCNGQSSTAYSGTTNAEWLAGHAYALGATITDYMIAVTNGTSWTCH